MQLRDIKLGQGTWNMGNTSHTAQEEIAALRFGIERGVTMIDTAEMYASGGSERVVGEAIQPWPRESLYIVSKVYPYNASARKMRDACIASLQRLGIDSLDCYLLHWPGSVPLAETVGAFEALQKEGLIRSWGVSNFDVRLMEELWRIPGGSHCITNQVLYNLASRGIEYDLLPWMQARNLSVMAYTPLAGESQWRRQIEGSSALPEVAARHNATIQQILLAFVMRHQGVSAIPKSAKISHLADNIASLEIRLTPNDLALLDRDFPPPTSRVPLATG